MVKLNNSSNLPKKVLNCRHEICRAKVVSFVSDEWLQAIAVGVEVRVPGAQTYLSGSKRPVRTVTYGNGEGQRGLWAGSAPHVSIILILRGKRRTTGHDDRLILKREGVRNR